METVIIHEATTIERTFAVNTPIAAGSDQPADGPWNATMRLVITDTTDPAKVWNSAGVWTEMSVPPGTYSITLTPTKLPFDGRIHMGAA